MALGSHQPKCGSHMTHMRLWLAVILWSIVGVQACTRPAATPTRRGEIAAVPAADYLVDAFDRFPLVAFSEPRHGAGGTREFLTSLVRHPRFAGTVNDIVVEFGNARYQDIADRYVAGEPVPRDQLKQIWENTTVVSGVWSAPMYEGMLSEIRNLNESVPLSKRIRVVLGDPPIDWSVVTGTGRRRHERLARRAFCVGGRRTSDEERAPRAHLDRWRAHRPARAVPQQLDSPPGPALPRTRLWWCCPSTGGTSTRR